MSSLFPRPGIAAALADKMEGCLNWLLNRQVTLFPTQGVRLRADRMLNWSAVLAPRLERRLQAVRRRAHQKGF